MSAHILPNRTVTDKKLVYLTLKSQDNFSFEIKSRKKKGNRPLIGMIQSAVFFFFGGGVQN